MQNPMIAVALLLSVVSTGAQGQLVLTSADSAQVVQTALLTGGRDLYSSDAVRVISLRKDAKGHEWPAEALTIAATSLRADLYHDEDVRSCARGGSRCSSSAAPEILMARGLLTEGDTVFVTIVLSLAGTASHPRAISRSREYALRRSGGRWIVTGIRTEGAS